VGAPYRQFCPVAKAMELLDERWTLLLVRELVIGSERFNDLRRGLPRMSPTLLSKRLQQLVRAGVVERRVDGDDVRYVLTDAGRELRPVVEALGAWGTRWIGELGDADLDPKLLLWDMHRNVDAHAVPRGRTVVRFVFTDVPPSQRHWWLVIDSSDSEADVCDVDPGFEVAVTVTGTLRRLTEIWRGDIRWWDAIRAGDVVIDGPEAMRRAFPRWLTLSTFATLPRPRGQGRQPAPA
jgi:DNA-binding HxlR family transcriptional regulator